MLPNAYDFLAHVPPEYKSRRQSRNLSLQDHRVTYVIANVKKLENENDKNEDRRDDLQKCLRFTRSIISHGNNSLPMIRMIGQSINSASASA